MKFDRLKLRHRRRKLDAQLATLTGLIEDEANTNGIDGTLGDRVKERVRGGEAGFDPTLIVLILKLLVMIIPLFIDGPDDAGTTEEIATDGDSGEV